MDMHIREVVRKLKDGLALNSEVVRFYAYGSRVRSDCDPTSELGLLVELRQVSTTARQRILDRAWELSLEEGYVIFVAFCKAGVMRA